MQSVFLIMRVLDNFSYNYVQVDASHGKLNTRIFVDLNLKRLPLSCPCTLETPALRNVIITCLQVVYSSQLLISISANTD